MSKATSETPFPYSTTVKKKSSVGELVGKEYFITLLFFIYGLFS